MRRQRPKHILTHQVRWLGPKTVVESTPKGRAPEGGTAMRTLSRSPGWSKRLGLVVACAAVLSMAGWSIPAGAADPAEPTLPLHNVTVLNDDGQAFPAGSAGLAVCPVDAVCDIGSPDLRIGFADANGTVQDLIVDPTVQYLVWPFSTICGLNIAASTQAMGWELARPTTFVAEVPPNCFEFSILDGNLRPFPTGAAVLVVCPDDSVPCVAPIFGGAFADGRVFVALDPSHVYHFGALATTANGTWDGWACGGFEYPPGSGVHFWGSSVVVGTPGDVSQNNGQFLIYEPDCT
jgi:hypothetical protein